MSREKVFLREIARDPENTHLRLVFADWLEERGDPRGEFIRLQCELAACGEDDPRRGGLESRAEDLLAEHEEDWAGPARELAVRWEFRRGFVEAIEIDVDTFVAHAPALFESTPIRDVRLLGGDCPYVDDAGVRRLLAVPETGRLAGLAIPHAGEGLSWEAIEELGHSPRASSLRRLDLECADDEPDSGLGWGCGEALAGCPYLAGLTALNLSGNRIGDEGVQALAQSPYLTRLESLRLAGNCLNCESTEVIAGARIYGELRDLDLGWNELDYDALRALLDSPFLPRLSGLHLKSAFPVGERGGRSLKLLRDSSKFSQLRSLSLGRNGLGPQGVKVLVAAPRLDPLRHLDLSETRLGDRGFAALAGCPRLTGLRTLDLSFNDIRGKSVPLLGAAAFVAPLTSLDLSHNPVGDVGVEALGGLRAAAGLRSLELAGCNITAAGVRALVSGPVMRQLTSLNLSWNPLGDEGLAALVRSPSAGRLRELYLSAVGCTEEGVTALARSVNFPRLKTLYFGREDEEMGAHGAVGAFVDPPGYRLLTRLYLDGWQPGRTVVGALRARWGRRIEI